MGKGRHKSEFTSKNNDSKTEDPEETVFDTIVPKWYDQFKDDKPLSQEPVGEEELNSLRAEAEQLLEQETNFYHSKDRKGKAGYDAAWLKTMLTKGTSKDKIAAHIISVQNAPQYNLIQLQGLINMVKASKQRDCISVMENLSDLFLEDLLIPSRKLKTFDKQPLLKLFEITSGCARSRKARLIAWIFEDKLKECYINFIQSVDNIAKDTVDSNRMKAVGIMNKLLTGHPEQEQLLLKTIINKLGDPNQKVVSKVIYCLTQLLRVHPNMKQVVMNEVEKFLFRPNLNKRAQYYSICFLTQYVFQSKDRDIARNIINIYFSFFKAAIKKGEVDSKLMGALLVGVKRAHPFAKLTSEVMKEHTDTLYKLVHLTPFNVSVHALCLLQEVATDSDDRFYTALYKKLLDPDIARSCHQAVFINLLYKAITKDSNISRVKAIIKRLLQICLCIPSPLACGFLYLLSQILSKRRQLLAFQFEPRELTTSVKIESDDEDEKYFDADIKESIEINENGALPTGKGEIEDEVLNDGTTVKIKEENESEDEIKFKEEPSEGWVFKNLSKPRKFPSMQNDYDPNARNPSFANADKSAYFELIGLVRHFHPSVALFAKQILTSERITYSGDPLADFTLVRFLDRFCFKNPKKINENVKGPDPVLAQRKYYKPAGAKSMAVLSQNYLSQDESQVPVDELFLFKYLRDKHGDGEKFNKKDDDDDNASVASEEFEEMLQGMMGGKKTAELDFMEDIGENLKKKKGAKDEDIESDLESEEEVGKEDEDDDEEDGEEGDDDLDDVDEEDIEFDDEGANAIDFMDDGEEDDIDVDNEFFNKDMSKQGVKNKKSKLKNVKKVKGLKMKGGLEGLFAPAEEFSEILEEAGASKQKPGMIHSMSNTDNADQKQLSWETKRDRWVRDADQRKRKFKNKSNQKFNGVKKRKKQ